MTTGALFRLDAVGLAARCCAVGELSGLEALQLAFGDLHLGLSEPVYPRPLSGDARQIVVAVMRFVNGRYRDTGIAAAVATIAAGRAGVGLSPEAAWRLLRTMRGSG